MKNIKQLGWLASGTSLLLWSAMAFAQMGGYPQTQPGNPGAAGPMGAPMGSTGAAGGQMQDHTFMMKAAEGGMAEVQLGQLAQQNGQSQAVKDFGKRMVDDHSKANDQLKQVATQQGVTLPSEPSSKDKAEYDRMAKLNGDAFDKAYAKMMVSDHKKDIAEFQREASAGSNPEVKGLPPRRCQPCRTT